MLYTKKGDDGTTKTFACDQRISKSSAVAEALGALDEINSFLGLVKVKSAENEDSNNSGNNASKNNTADKTTLTHGKHEVLGKSFAEIVGDIQQNLFIIQAEVAGSKMTLSEDKLKECENYVDQIEKTLPPIKTFFISGGTELASLFDIARTVSRRAERRVVAIISVPNQDIGHFTIAYLNRLSSLLYALARLSNFIGGIEEDTPSYNL